MKIITKLGACSTKKKPLGMQFIAEPNKSILGGTYSVVGDGMQVSPEDLATTIELGPSFKSAGCRLCGNKYAFRCNGCGRLICYDGNAKTNFECPACGAKGNVPKAVGDTVPSSDAFPRGASPYNECAGQSNIPGARIDKFGNPDGAQYDLAQDGSFQGYTIVVLNLCDECIFTEPQKALEKKGFAIKEFKTLPPLNELSRLLTDKSQLWLISHRIAYLDSRYVSLIADYYNSGHGVYIWGDNEPYYADANLVLRKIFNTEMYGNAYGDKVLGIQSVPNGPGIIANHPITTGIVNFYEGITIATVKVMGKMVPLMYGSACNIVTAYYDADGKRALIDGGFTRLFFKWNSAGTDRYVVNAAAWLANIERFGYQPKR